ncbi:MAG: Spy/CpxP family protein refolding chaperone [Thermoanaerobaculia bacterium]
MPSKRNPYRNVLPFALLVGSLGIGGAALAQVGPTPAPKPPAGDSGSPSAAPAAGGSSAPAASPRARRGDAALSGAENAWWHRKIGTDLGLTDAQRQKLDATSEKLNRDLGTSQESLRTVRGTLQSALQNGDWAAARRAYETQATHAAANIRLQGEAQIALLTALTAEQRKQLATTYPNLLTAPVGRSRQGRFDPPAKDAPAPKPAPPASKP